MTLSAKCRTKRSFGLRRSNTNSPYPFHQASHSNPIAAFPQFREITSPRNGIGSIGGSPFMTWAKLVRQINVAEFAKEVRRWNNLTQVENSGSELARPICHERNGFVLFFDVTPGCCVTRGFVHVCKVEDGVRNQRRSLEGSG